MMINLSKMNKLSKTYILPILVTLLLFRRSTAHGLMTDPAQRGALNPRNNFNNKSINETAPNDGKPHFPAGDKSPASGAAARSQQRAVAYWRPFQPLEKSFQWRAGVCGDEIGKEQDHMRGGKYYNGGEIVKNWIQGQVIEVETNIVGHHNGFMELHLCDVEKCGGEISQSCFKNGFCYHLRRAKNPSCDSGYDRRCAPIDPVYPHRWYLPCTTKPENVQPNFFGRSKMTYELPEEVSCEHCVLHWFWSAANTCNPPGVVEFFEGAHGPKNWGDCHGQGGARGGYTKVQPDCGPDRFPEEYYQCADVRIVEKARAWNQGNVNMNTTTPSSTPTPTPTPIPTAIAPSQSNGSAGDPSRWSSALKGLSLVADGVHIGGLPNGTVVDISGYSKVAVEAITNTIVGEMKFYVDEVLVWTDYYRPYFMFGNTGSVPWYWDDPIVNRWFSIRAMAEGDEIESRILFVGNRS